MKKMSEYPQGYGHIVALEDVKDDRLFKTHRQYLMNRLVEAFMDENPHLNDMQVSNNLDHMMLKAMRANKRSSAYFKVKINESYGVLSKSLTDCDKQYYMETKLEDNSDISEEHN